MADIQQVHSITEPIPSVPAIGPAPKRSGFGIAALAVGVVALAGSLVPVVTYGAGILALVGLVLGVVGLRAGHRRRGVAVGGVAVSGVALLLSIALAVAYSIVIASDADAADVAGPAASARPGGVQAGTEGGQSPLGSRARPAPLGTTVQIDSAAGPVDWEVTLGSPTLDADDLIAAESDLAEPAPAGFQYAMIPVTVVYRGTETGTPWADLAVDFVSAAGTAHSSSETFAVAPEPLTDVNELTPGASGTGNVVVAVPRADAEDGTWVVATVFGDRYHFTAR
jgi:hypothetical protein